jgi:hypothetical protein
MIVRQSKSGYANTLRSLVGAIELSGLPAASATANRQRRKPGADASTRSLLREGSSE